MYFFYFFFLSSPLGHDHVQYPELES